MTTTSNNLANTYYVLRFPEEDDSVALVHKNLMINTHLVKWPTRSKDVRNNKIMIHGEIKGIPSEETNCVIMYCTNDLDKANFKLKRAEDDSNIETASSSTEKIKSRKRRAKVVSDSSEEEEFEKNKRKHIKFPKINRPTLLKSTPKAKSFYQEATPRTPHSKSKSPYIEEDSPKTPCYYQSTPKSNEPPKTSRQKTPLKTLTSKPSTSRYHEYQKPKPQKTPQKALKSKSSTSRSNEYHEESQNNSRYDDSPQFSASRPCSHCKGKASNNELSKILVEIKNVNKKLDYVTNDVQNVNKKLDYVTNDVKEVKRVMSQNVNVEKDSEVPVALLSKFPLQSTDSLNTFFAQMKKDDRQALTHYLTKRLSSDREESIHILLRFFIHDCLVNEINWSGKGLHNVGSKFELQGTNAMKFIQNIVINNVKSLTDAEFATAVINWQKKRYDCLKKREQRKQAKNRRTVRSQSPDDE